jgi:hypothetical protein
MHLHVQLHLHLPLLPLLLVAPLLQLVLTLLGQRLTHPTQQGLQLSPSSPMRVPQPKLPRSIWPLRMLFNKKEQALQMLPFRQ